MNINKSSLASLLKLHASLSAEQQQLLVDIVADVPVPSPPATVTVVHIFPIQRDISRHDVFDYFDRAVGRVDRVDIPLDGRGHRCKYGFVHFKSARDADRAVARREHEIKPGVVVHASLYSPSLNNKKRERDPPSSPLPPSKRARTDNRGDNEKDQRLTRFMVSSSSETPTPEASVQLAVPLATFLAGLGLNNQ